MALVGGKIQIRTIYHLRKNIGGSTMAQIKILKRKKGEDDSI